MLLLLQQVATYCAHAYPGIHLKSCPAHTLEIGLEQLLAVLCSWPFRDRMPFSTEAARGSCGGVVRLYRPYELPTPQLKHTELRNWPGYFSRTQGEIPMEAGFPKTSTFQIQNLFYLVTSGGSCS